MTEEELEKIRESGKDPTPAQVDDYNETLRVWRTRCPHCDHTLTGTLTEIRAFFARCDRLCRHDHQTG
jgi:hypothetical protein